jgi:chaperonin cofactor prefoldin
MSSEEEYEKADIENELIIFLELLVKCKDRLEDTDKRMITLEKEEKQLTEEYKELQKVVDALESIRKKIKVKTDALQKRHRAKYVQEA